MFSFHENEYTMHDAHYVNQKQVVLSNTRPNKRHIPHQSNYLPISAFDFQQQKRPYYKVRPSTLQLPTLPPLNERHRVDVRREATSNYHYLQQQQQQQNVVFPQHHSHPRRGKR